MKTIKISATAVKLFSLTLVLTLLIGFQTVSAQLFFSDFEGSQVKISGSKNNSQFAPVTNHFSCEGKFTMLNGELQHLNALKFDLPLNLKNKNQALIDPVALNTSQAKNNISFELTHSMVLPESNIIHAIGYLDVQGVKTRIDFHLNFIENNSEMITVMGRRSIKLSDYKKEAISVFANEKAQDIVQVDLKLVIKNPAKVNYLAAK